MQIEIYLTRSQYTVVELRLCGLYVLVWVKVEEF